jgi:hypothetical protein
LLTKINLLEKQIEIKDKDISQLRTSLISLNHSVKLANAAQERAQTEFQYIQFSYQQQLVKNDQQRREILGE